MLAAILNQDVPLSPANVAAGRRELQALLAVAAAAVPFERLKNSRSACSDAYHISADHTAQRSIGQNLTAALEALVEVRPFDEALVKKLPAK